MWSCGRGPSLPNSRSLGSVWEALAITDLTRVDPGAVEVFVAMDGSVNECGICLGERTSPVKLPCGHSFCEDCLG